MGYEEFRAIQDQTANSSLMLEPCTCSYNHVVSFLFLTPYPLYISISIYALYMLFQFTCTAFFPWGARYRTVNICFFTAFFSITLQSFLLDLLPKSFCQWSLYISAYTYRLLFDILLPETYFPISPILQLFKLLFAVAGAVLVNVTYISDPPKYTCSDANSESHNYDYGF